MWETPFEESMLSAQPGVAIYCEDDKAAEELFEVFKQNEIGKHWNAGVYGERAYCVSKSGGLQWVTKSAVESTHPYSNFIKCTFYGIDTPDFDVASDDELRALFGIGGG